MRSSMRNGHDTSGHGLFRAVPQFGEFAFQFFAPTERTLVASTPMVHIPR
jgi:hypothetical protein